MVVVWSQRKNPFLPAIGVVAYVLHIHFPQRRYFMQRVFSLLMMLMLVTACAQQGGGLNKKNRRRRGWSRSGSCSWL
jgi:hypothetical protein